MDPWAVIVLSCSLLYMYRVLDNVLRDFDTGQAITWIRKTRPASEKRVRWVRSTAWQVDRASRQRRRNRMMLAVRF